MKEKEKRRGEGEWVRDKERKAQAVSGRITRDNHHPSLFILAHVSFSKVLLLHSAVGGKNEKNKNKK